MYLERPFEAEGFWFAIDIAALLLQQYVIYICVFRKHAYYPKVTLTQLNVLPLTILVILFCKTPCLNLLGLWAAAYILSTIDIYF